MNPPIKQYNISKLHFQREMWSIFILPKSFQMSMTMTFAMSDMNGHGMKVVIEEASSKYWNNSPKMYNFAYFLGWRRKWGTDIDHERNWGK